jgi:hypothetical protein
MCGTFKGPTKNINIHAILRLRNSILWDITPCSPLQVNRRFGRKFRLNFSEPCSARHALHACFLLCVFFQPWRWRWHVPPKRRFTFNGLQGVISQKLELFITTDVRTSNPKYVTLLTCSESAKNSTLEVCIFLCRMLWTGLFETAKHTVFK